ncbi:MAG: hypothetical protein CW338_06130, partial [Clostridiales bacterium]|nr:hypothetical protein [Clostridiales bacterium]
EDGQLYLGPITLSEGYWGLRAVCVSSELVSDELSVNYTVTLPAPQAPYFNLASNTYNTASVKIKNLNDFPVTIYYTIDGTSPTANSPIYDGTPIVLPRGKQVHLKAVCVDANGKVSNERDVEYEILKGDFKYYFREGDSFSGFTLMETKRDNFVKKYPGFTSDEKIDDSAIPDQCYELTYSWGCARFFSSENGFTLYYVETSSSDMVGPRSTKVGMSKENVLKAFRDMGQARNQDGSRSIYYDDSVGYARETPTVDGKSQINYVYYRNDDATVTLSYFLENDTVVKISILCSY